MRQVVEQQHLDWLARSFGRHDYAPLSAADVESIRAVGEVISKYPGTHLFREGAPADAAYVVESGEVEIYRGAKDNPRIVGRVGPGSVLGDIAMFGDTPYVSSAKVIGPTRLFRFERDRLLPELARHPALCLRWLVAGQRQLEDTQRRVLRLMQKTVLSQVADLLLEEGERGSEVRLSQATIGALLGVSRQSVNEALGKLREQGIVETGYRSIHIIEADRLATLAA